jgi:hypothetical protein
MKRSNATWKVIDGSRDEAPEAETARNPPLHEAHGRAQRQGAALVPATLEAITESGRVVVSLAGRQTEVTLALAVSDQALVEAVRERRRGLAVEVDGEGWVLMALLRDRVGALALGPTQPGALSGEHVEIEGEQAVTLGCGESSIELRADGRIALRGRDVLVVSSGVASLQGAR